MIRSIVGILILIVGLVIVLYAKRVGGWWDRLSKLSEQEKKYIYDVLGVWVWGLRAVGVFTIVLGLLILAKI